MNQATIKLASDLIGRTSVTPEDAGCQLLLANRLAESGFTAEYLRYDNVDNLWLTHGSGAPVFTFLGHTDVVPPGPAADWQYDPFKPVLQDGYLYGRGAADMKGSIAAMTTAMERFVIQHPQHKGTLSMLLTSDEEGIAINGTKKVIDYLQQQELSIDWCLVGEPSSQEKIADTIKIGRRGSLTATMKVYGIQGHVAYPDLAKNPIHLVMPALSELCNIVWDNGNKHYPPTSLQISNINAGTGADNVIPGVVEIMFNIRYSTESSEQKLMDGVQDLLNRHQLQYEIDWHSSGVPFITKSGQLLQTVKNVIEEISGYETQESTSGGTSDGRFVAPTGAEVIELGPVNATIHKVNECVRVDDLETLSKLYERIIHQLLA